MKLKNFNKRFKRASFKSRRPLFVRAQKRKFLDEQNEEQKRRKLEVHEENEISIECESNESDVDLDVEAKLLQTFRRGSECSDSETSVSENEDELESEESVYNESYEGEDIDGAVERMVENVEEDDSEESLEVDGEEASSISDESDDNSAEENNFINNGEENADKEMLLPSQDDPFCRHFERHLPLSARAHIQNTASWNLERHTWQDFGLVIHKFPQQLPDYSEDAKLSKLLLFKAGQPPTLGNSVILPRNLENFDLNKMSIKHCVQKNVSDLTDLQKKLLFLLTDYSDLYFPISNYNLWKNITEVYCIHAVNHVLKSKARILLNNKKLNEAKQSKVEVDFGKFADQGLSTPKVLILLPSRHSAYRVVKCIERLLNIKKVRQMERFNEDFGSGVDEEAVVIPRSKRDRPKDFLATFFGNTSDDFKIGVKLEKHSMQLYANFYTSDIIIGSPIGLRLTTGIEGEDNNNNSFLSSIEVLIADQTDMFLMQNWDHVTAILENVNSMSLDSSIKCIPTNRVRRWFAQGLAKLYRQTIFFSSVSDDQQRSLFLDFSSNFAGSYEVLPLELPGVMDELRVTAKLNLLRAPGRHSFDDRFAFFRQEYLPHFMAKKQKHTLLYISDYSDYYFINEYLCEERAITFSTINEYMTEKMSQVAVARSDFYKGESSLLLYTERFHFYKRPMIKGVRHVVFFSPPTYPHFFPEICNMIEWSRLKLELSSTQRQISPSITLIYQDSDKTCLASIMGARRTSFLLSSKKSVHMCSTKKL